MAGRPPKPTEIKRMAGNPGKRPLNDREPELTVKMPSCPKWLLPEARSEWRRLAKELTAKGVLTVGDRAALAAYCQMWARWVQIEEELDRLEDTKEGKVRKHQLIGKTDKGYAFMSPLLGAAHATLKQMKAFAVELGLTPASRTRIKTQPVTEEKSLAEILFESAIADVESERAEREG